MIRFPAAVRDELLDHARAGAPIEVCGVLAGRFDEAESRVEVAYPASNAAAKRRTRYRIDDEELLALLERIEGEGQETVGFYHSHPNGPPAPSEIDRERATWDGRSYVIVSLGSEPTIRSWRWRREEGAFQRESVLIE